MCPREMFLTLSWFPDTHFSHLNISEIRVRLVITNKKALCHSLISSVFSSWWFVIELCVSLLVKESGSYP